MVKNQQNDIKTVGYVLRRTNYGEADRILNLITPMGKMAVLAKGVRKAKSKLAGGVEMFTRSEVVVHQGRGALGTLTGAKMQQHHANIVKDFARMELAGTMLRRVNVMAEEMRVGENGEVVEVNAEGYFEMIDESLTALDEGANPLLVEAWFLMNLARVSGEEVNLYRDVAGERLVAEARYAWDTMERALVQREGGMYGVEEIKLMRLAVTARLAVVRRVKGVDDKWTGILQLARSVVK